MDVLNKTEAMELDLSINDHVDTAKVERLLSDKSKFSTQANQVQNEVLRFILKAFSDMRYKRGGYSEIFACIRRV